MFTKLLKYDKIKSEKQLKYAAQGSGTEIYVKRILVFSDTHGNFEKAISIINSTPNIDACIHCGDMLRDCHEIERAFPRLPFYYVCGNNDYTFDVPYDIDVTIGGNKILVTHGHRYRVKMGTSLLKQKFSEGYDIILYGHTHQTDSEWVAPNKLILNPGSLGYISSTYALLEIAGKGDFKFSFLN